MQSADVKSSTRVDLHGTLCLCITKIELEVGQTV